jgi:hypothetical protein
MIFIPHLETDVTQACQLSCVACNHHVPLWRKHGPRTAKPEEVARDLGRLARFIHADRWGALGGEPLLHNSLVEILSIARESKIADKTEVWTNGLRLQAMGADFWRAFDILVLSIYPGKISDSQLEWIRWKAREEGRELVEKDERKHPNFKTLFEPSPTDAAATRSKFSGCFFRSFSRVANYGYFFTCCCAPHMPLLVNGKPFGTDGLLIESIQSESDVRAYLERSEPLESCSTCAGRDTAVSIPWSEERDPSRWLAASAGVTV